MRFSDNYDGAGRLTSIANPYSDSFNWSYLNNNWLSGQVSKYASSGNVVCNTTYSYNALGEMTDLLNATSGGARISEFGYDSAHSENAPITYDAVGNRTTLSATISSDTTYSGSTAYSYNGQDELNSESSTRNGSYTNTFAYDGARNPTTMGGASGITYNSDNQVTSGAYTYDGDGNPTHYNGNTAVFDAENRMTAFSSSLTAGYGTDNLRAFKTDGSGTTYYLYDEIGEPIAEFNSGGTVTATNTFGANGLVARYSGAAEEFYAFDPGGSTAERINATGGVDTSIETDAFGNRTESSTTSDPLAVFDAQSGYITDAATGLQLLGHRYYDPGAGRFINRDPVGQLGGLNLYCYVGNQPVNFFDSAGYWPDAPYRPVHDPIPGNYGYHCGPFVSTPGNMKMGPEDAIDECCRLHDACLDAVGRSRYCWPAKWAMRKKCDADLCACALKALHKCTSTPCLTEAGLVSVYFCGSNIGSGPPPI